MKFVLKFKLGFLPSWKYLVAPVNGNLLGLVASLLYVKLRPQHICVFKFVVSDYLHVSPSLSFHKLG
jgi:hypothetical protein